MLYVTGAMLAVFVIWQAAMPGLINMMAFSRSHILAGEFWRVITFALIPPALNSSIWLLLALFVAYRLGTNLEHTWGKTLFTLYFFFGMLGAIISGFITGFGTNQYFLLSILLAFCYLNPNMQFLLFFIIPVKAKYIALFNWVMYALAFINANFAGRVAIIFSLINFFIFFGPDVFKTIRQNYNTSKRRRRYQKNWGDNNPWR